MYDKDGLLMKAANEENTLEFIRDKKTGRITEEHQNGYTVSHTYDKEGNRLHTTSNLGADIRHTYDKQGDLEAMQAGDNWQASWLRDNTGLELQRVLTGGVTMQTTRDRFGREVHKGIRSGSREQGRYSYRWGIANRLLSKENELTGTVTTYDYDEFDFLIREQQTSGQSTESIYRMPDRIGNLFESPDKKDRTYAPGGRLEADKEFHYHYDDEGNLIFKEYRTQQPDITNYHRKAEEQELKITFKATGTGWRYDWYANGMLKKVTRPDGQTVHFTYDVLGRRTSKLFKGKLTRWVWDGNTPLHEWSYRVKEQLPNREKDKEPTENLITWVFEAGTFVPAAKLTEGKQYSIITDYLGTPIQMYDDEGKLSWDCTLDIYGKVRSFSGYSSVDCPFRYQGQYQDEETGLYYNRFRYYSPEEGMYISQDPIGLAGGDRLYAYVHDVNSWLDPFGLSKQSCSQKKGINKATHDLKKMVLQ